MKARFSRRMRQVANSAPGRFVQRYPHVIMVGCSAAMFVCGQPQVGLVLLCGAAYEHIRTELLVNKMEGAAA